MSAGTLHEIGGFADGDDFNWQQHEVELLLARDAGYGMSARGYDYMTGNEVGRQRLGRMTMGGGRPPDAPLEVGDLQQVAAQEATQRLARMGLQNY